MGGPVPSRERPRGLEGSRGLAGAGGVETLRLELLPPSTDEGAVALTLDVQDGTAHHAA